MSARRYNKAKNRIELIPTQPLLEIAEVYTRGAHKYTIYENEAGESVKGVNIPFEDRGNYKIVDDGADNWKNGMSWKETMGSVKRHIAAWDLSEDIDSELGTKHLANAAWGLITLLEYQKTRPHFDDRDHAYLKYPKIGLDIDEVICDWVTAWIKKFDLHVPTSWFFDYDIMDRFEQLRKAGELDEFYMNLEPRITPEDIPFEPHAYVTSRPVDTAITIEWLKKHKFPTRPVITVPPGTSKVQAIKESGIEVFVDDRFENFLELNKAGICTYLMDAPHNHRYNVGYKRIKSLKELI